MQFDDFFSIFHITLSFRSEILAASEGKALARFVRSDIYVDVELRGAMETSNIKLDYTLKLNSFRNPKSFREKLFCLVTKMREGINIFVFM